VVDIGKWTRYNVIICFSFVVKHTVGLRVCLLASHPYRHMPRNNIVFIILVRNQTCLLLMERNFPTYLHSEMLRSDY